MTSQSFGPSVCGGRIPDHSGRLLVVTVFLLLAGCVEPTEPGDPSDEPVAVDPEVVAFYDALATDPGVTFETDHGDIQLLVYSSLMPRTSAHFLSLVASGFHNDTLVHRVVDDFVIQGGDPSGTGQLGSGEAIAFESHPALHYAHGSMGLARDLDPDSGDSQWFITEKPQPHLHAPSGTTGTVFGAYALYAQVHTGMDTVRRIAAVDTVPGADRPIEEVRVRAATVVPPPAVDLLQLPPQVARTSGSAHNVDIVRPLHVFSERPFPLTVFVEPLEEGHAVPATVTATLAHENATHHFVLRPLDADPAVYVADITLAESGAWHVTVAVGSDEAHDALDVHAWHPDYARYDRS